MLEVKDVMKIVKPQVVFLELCSERAFVVDPSEGIKSEWGVASEEAKKYGSEVILGDRPEEITKKRLYAKIYRMPYWQMAKVSFTMLLHFVLMLFPKSLSKKLWDAYQRPQPDADPLYECWSILLMEHVPAWKDVYMTERDQYMSAKILEVACKRKSVFAIVGGRHLPGIQKYWKQPIKGIKTEFLVASEEAKKYGSEVILGDRPEEITMKRLYAKIYRMPYWQMAEVSFTMPLVFVLMLFPKFLSDKSYSFWDACLQSQGDPVLYPLLKCWHILLMNIPDWKDVFVTERDQYMSAKLLEVARKR